MNSTIQTSSLLTALPRHAVKIIMFASMAALEITLPFAPVSAQTVNPSCINTNIANDANITINRPGFWYYESSSPSPSYASRSPVNGDCRNYWNVGVYNANNRRVQIGAYWADTWMADPASCAASSVNYYVWGWRNGVYTPLGGGTLAGQWNSAFQRCAYNAVKPNGSGLDYILSTAYSHYRISTEAYKTGGCTDGRLKCPQQVKVWVYTDPPTTN